MEVSGEIMEVRDRQQGSRNLASHVLLMHLSYLIY